MLEDQGPPLELPGPKSGRFSGSNDVVPSLISSLIHSLQSITPIVARQAATAEGPAKMLGAHLSSDVLHLAESQSDALTPLISASEILAELIPRTIGRD
jgi:hypothetical protein